MRDDVEEAVQQVHQLLEIQSNVIGNIFYRDILAFFHDFLHFQGVNGQKLIISGGKRGP